MHTFALPAPNRRRGARSLQAVSVNAARTSRHDVIVPVEVVCSTLQGHVELGNAPLQRTQFTAFVWFFRLPLKVTATLLSSDTSTRHTCRMLSKCERYAHP